MAVSTTMKSGTFKEPPKEKMYRLYKNFNKHSFNDAPKTELDNY